MTMWAEGRDTCGALDLDSCESVRRRVYGAACAVLVQSGEG